MENKTNNSNATNIKQQDGRVHCCHNANCQVLGNKRSLASLLPSENGVLKQDKQDLPDNSAGAYMLSP